MNKEQLCEALDHVNHSREKRKEMALIVSRNEQLIRPLMELAIENKKQISSKACWVMEFTAKENLSFIYPYLDQFTQTIAAVKLDSSIRPVAKICEYLIKAYFQKKNSEVITVLQEKHLEEITSTCYDCHSNNTEYPWYNNIAPISYWLADHVKDGKKHLNFSDWESYSVKKKAHKLEEVAEMMEDGEMPLKEYTWIHEEAQLSEEQKNDVISWAQQTRALYQLNQQPK